MGAREAHKEMTNVVDADPQRSLATMHARYGRMVL
jgi:hypothetical protein